MDAAGGATYTELKESGREGRSPLARVGLWSARIGFVFIFLTMTMPAWTYALVTDVFCPPKTAEARRRRGRFMGVFMRVLWRAAFNMAWWIRVDAKAVEPLYEAGKKGRQVFIAINHVSMMDSAVICAYTPRNLIGDAKTLMARRFQKLPIIGRISKAIGHLPVPFTSATRGNFSVDKEKLAESMKLLEDHLNAGGHIELYPEGDLNSNWQHLNPFRAGSIEIAIKHDMEVWGWVMAGTGECWPEHIPLGGGPAHIRMKTALLYPSAKEAAERLAGPDSTREQAIALANDMRAKMQKMVDELSGAKAVADADK